MESPAAASIESSSTEDSSMESSSPTMESSVETNPTMESSTMETSPTMESSTMDDSMAYDGNDYSESSESSESSDGMLSSVESDEDSVDSIADDLDLLMDDDEEDIDIEWIKEESMIIPDEDKELPMEVILKKFEGAVVCEYNAGIDEFPLLLETMLFWEIPMTEHFFTLCVTAKDLDKINLSPVKEHNLLHPFALFFDAFKTMDSVTDLEVRIDSAFAAVFPDCDVSSGCDLLRGYADVFIDKRNLRRDRKSSKDSDSVPSFDVDSPMDEEEEEEVGRPAEESEQYGG